MFDQPLRVIRSMEAALYTAEAFEERAAAAKRGKLVEWAETHPQQLDYCRQVDELLNEESEDQ